MIKLVKPEAKRKVKKKQQPQRRWKRSSLELEMNKLKATEDKN